MCVMKLISINIINIKIIYIIFIIQLGFNSIHHPTLKNYCGKVPLGDGDAEE